MKHYETTPAQNKQNQLFCLCTCGRGQHRVTLHPPGVILPAGIYNLRGHTAEVLLYNSKSNLLVSSFLLLESPFSPSTDQTGLMAVTAHEVVLLLLADSCQKPTLNP